MVDFEEIPNDPEAPLDSSPERAIMVVPCGDRNVRKSIYIGVNRFLSADEQPSCSIPVYRMTRVTGSFIGSFQRWLLEDDSRVQFELRNLAALNFMTGTFDVMFYIWSETLLDGRRIARLGRPHQLLSEVLLESICLFKRRDNTDTKPENWYQDDNRVVRDSIRFHSDGGIQVRDEHFNLLGWIFYQSCANYDELSAQISFCARRGGLEEPYTTRFEADDDCVPTQDFKQFFAKLKWINLYPTRDGDRNDDDVVQGDDYVQADDENNAIRDEDGIVAIKMKWKKMRVKWKKMRVHWKKIRVMMTWKKLQMVQWVKTKMKKLNKMSNGIAKGAD